MNISRYWFEKGAHDTSGERTFEGSWQHFGQFAHEYWGK